MYTHSAIHKAKGCSTADRNVLQRTFSYSGLRGNSGLVISAATHPNHVMECTGSYGKFTRFSSFTGNIDIYHVTLAYIVRVGLMFTRGFSNGYQLTLC